MDHFDHENLDVVEQATSISLNVAEGAGEISPREKVRFYRMAKRSATECAAILDAVRIWDAQGDQRWVAAVTLEAGRKVLLRTVSMLVKMVKATESRYG